MNWEKFGEVAKARLETMTHGQQFRWLAGLYSYLPYIGGRENWAFGADCSGTVCGPLWLMGYDIRCTANDLYEKIFTELVEDFEDDEDILAVFYISEIERRHFGMTVQPGYAIHVTPVIGRYVVQNAFDPIKPMTAVYVRQWYESNHCKAEWRRLDMHKLKTHSYARDLVYGVDPILKELRS